MLCLSAVIPDVIIGELCPARLNCSGMFWGRNPSLRSSTLPNSAARQSLDRLRILLRHGTQQRRQAEEVVGRSHEREHPAHLPGAAEAGLALPTQHQTTL